MMKIIKKLKNLQRERQINNRDPYKDSEPEVGGLSYPVIFEPIQNVEFSRSVYKVTSMVDFTSYVEYFRKYEQYLTKLYRDIRKEEKVKIITNPFRLLKERNYTSYLPLQLDNIDCDRPEVYKENPSRLLSLVCVYLHKPKRLQTITQRNQTS